MVSGGDMKDIEAWLMQTDGGQGLSADWQPPSHRGEDEAVPERTGNATYSDSETSSVQLPEAGTDRQELSATSPRELDLLPEGVGSEYMAGHADNRPASCTSDTGGAGLDPFSTCNVADSESDPFVTNRDADLGAAGNHAANMTAPPSNGVRTDGEQNIGSMDNEDYVDERQLMEYLRQLEMERSEELLLERTEERLLEQTEEQLPELLQEAVIDNNTSSRQGFSDSRSTGARPKVSLKLNSLPYLYCYQFCRYRYRRIRYYLVFFSAAALCEFSSSLYGRFGAYNWDWTCFRRRLARRQFSPRYFFSFCIALFLWAVSVTRPPNFSIPWVSIVTGTRSSLASMS
jgi:hypothetical protein